MKKEISWEFSRSAIKDDYLPAISDDEHVRYVMSGRTGFDLIIQDLRKKKRQILKACFPSYCSRSMMQAFFNNGVSISFYQTRIGHDGFIFEYDEHADHDAVILMDYFGYCNAQLKKIADSIHKKGRIVITDITQSVFCGTNYWSFSDYVIGSYRKWLPSNSAYVYSKTPFSVAEYTKVSVNFERTRNTAYNLKQLYIDTGSILADTFLTQFDQSEVILKQDYIGYAASRKELNVFKDADTDFIVSRRKQNAELLTCLFADNAKVHPVFPTVKPGDCPLYVPLLLAPSVDRQKLRNSLFQEGFFLPVHWRPSYLHPKVLKDPRPYTSLLSCVCDQRYSEDDMLRIYQAITDYAV